MILNKEDYIRYLEADRKALGMKRKRPKVLGDYIWKFQILMRKLEYIRNCKGKRFKLYFHLLNYKYKKMSIKLGYSIPYDCAEEGLSLAHRGTIVINPKVKIGKNCRIHICVNIGDYNGGAPVIGNNVYIGPGAKLFGDIEIADGVKIGANAVVNKSFVEPNITIAGVPAKKVK